MIAGASIVDLPRDVAATLAACAQARVVSFQVDEDIDGEPDQPMQWSAKQGMPTGFPSKILQQLVASDGLMVSSDFVVSREDRRIVASTLSKLRDKGFIVRCHKRRGSCGRLIYQYAASDLVMELHGRMPVVVRPARGLRK